MLALRQLPDYFVSSRRPTPLGTIIILDIDKKALGVKDYKPDKFQFEILIRDKYPFQPPLVVTKS